MPRIITERPLVSDYAPYYGKYIRMVPEGDLVAIAEAQVEELTRALVPVDDGRSRFRYADGKWSIREVIGHLTDTERVFSYRATAFSRGDAQPLPGYDQALWNPLGEYDDRDLSELVDEWIAARCATVALMRYMPAAALTRRGIASQVEFSVLALLSILPGHVAYHIERLRHDYLEAFAVPS
jgi:hypothetical protein